MPSNWSFSPRQATTRAGKAAPSFASVDRDREVGDGHEALALALALDDDPQRDRLHAPGREAAPDLLPEQLRDLVADEPVDDAAGLLRARPGPARSSPGFSIARVDRRLRDLVELGAVEAGLRRLLLQQLVEVPADRLALAVGVGGEEDAVGLAGEPRRARRPSAPCRGRCGSSARSSSRGRPRCPSSRGRARGRSRRRPGSPCRGTSRGSTALAGDSTMTRERAMGTGHSATPVKPPR